MAARYRKVHQQEDEQAEEINKKNSAERVDKITAKLHAIAWIVAGTATTYFTNIIHISYSDDRVNRIAMNLSVVALVANIGIIIYLTLYLPLIAKITIPWEVYCPNMIPTSTGLGVACFVLMNIAYWPVYGLLTPAILTIILLGLLFSTHFIPWPC